MMLLTMVMTMVMMTILSAMTIVTKYSLPTIDFATRYSTRYSDFLLQPYSKGKKPTRLCLAGIQWNIHVYIHVLRNVYL